MEQTLRCEEFFDRTSWVTINKRYIGGLGRSNIRKENSLKKYALVTAGGILGALSRYVLSELISDQWRAVFIINQLGVLLAGLIIYKIKSNEEQRLFWIAGFSGGFTTFSSFAVLNLKGDPLANVIISSVSFLLSLLIIRSIGRVKKV